MNRPLVSVICLCYNQGQFIEQAVRSVLNQTYPNIQLIVVDDASTDNSVAAIKSLVAQYPTIQVELLPQNLGNCKAFNKGLVRANGSFIVDLAADDMFLPERIEKQINFFETLPSDYGVVFTDAEYIDRDGKFIRNHFQYLKDKNLLREVPEGDVYQSLVGQYFIASPTMLVKREVVTALNGYDEALTYEDFDFWVRSSRIYKYGFLNERLTQIRRTGKSMSSDWYKRGDEKLQSTYLVCRKAQQLSRSRRDDDALIRRVKFEFRQTAFSRNDREAELFLELLRELKAVSWVEQMLIRMVRLKFPLSVFRTVYHKLRFGESGLV